MILFFIKQYITFFEMTPIMYPCYFNVKVIYTRTRAIRIQNMDYSKSTKLKKTLYILKVLKLGNYTSIRSHFTVCIVPIVFNSAFNFK